MIFDLNTFRIQPTFKKLSPYVRKVIINIGSMYPESIFNERNPLIFSNIDISKLSFLHDRGGYFDIVTKTQDDKLSVLLRKIMQYNYCLSFNSQDIMVIKKFTVRQSTNQSDFLYHRTNTSPDIIMKEGLKPHYSLGIKAHPPLVFLSNTEGKWYGKYEYKIKSEQQRYIDTNLDWRCLDKRGYLYVKEHVNPENIISFKNV